MPFGQANVPPEYHTWTPQGWAKTKPQDYLRPKVNVSDIFDDPNSELDIDEELGTQTHRSGLSAPLTSL